MARYRVGDQKTGFAGDPRRVAAATPRQPEIIATLESELHSALNTIADDGLFRRAGKVGVPRMPKTAFRPTH